MLTLPNILQHTTLSINSPRHGSDIQSGPDSNESQGQSSSPIVPSPNLPHPNAHQTYATQK
jgi:predicted amidohydrolase